MLQGENKEQLVNHTLIKCAPSYFSEQTRPAYPWRNPNGSQIKGSEFFLAERQIEICMIRFEHCSSPQLDAFILIPFSQRAPFKVTQRREVMKWSNYVSICAIQVKPGVKFPICAPAVSSIHCAFSPVLPVRW